MAIQSSAVSILNKIIYEKIPFSLALKQAFKKDDTDKENKVAISALVGCALRHYLVMEAIIKNAYPEIESDGFLAILVVLSDVLFIKKTSLEECYAFASSFLKENDKPIVDFIAPYLEDKKLVPDNIEVGSLEFLSYRYNIPLPVIRMWNKHYGHITLSKMLKSLSKPAPVVVRINNLRISDDDLFSTYPDFEKCDVAGVSIYRGKEKIKFHEAYTRHLVEQLPLAYKDLIDEGDVDLLRGLAIYSEYANDILLELLSRNETLNNVEFIAGNYSAYNSTKNTLNRLSIRGVNLYEANAQGIITCLSKPVHSFIVMPDSSRFNLFQILPDYFLRFEMENLDNLISNQSLALKEASQQIEDGGYLMYLVDTISKKESISVINQFLKENPNFTLVREKQYFPFKKYGGSYFIAVMKKGQNND